MISQTRVAAPTPVGVSHPTVATGRSLVALLGGLLSLLAVVELGWTVAMVLVPIETIYGEGLVHGLAARLVRGEPLYQPRDQLPYVVNPYAPPYFLLAALLQVAAGPGFVAGRLLSFAAGLITAGLIGYLAAKRSGDRQAGFFATTLFLAFGLQWVLYRVDLVALALSLGAISCLAGGTSWRRVLLAGGLVCLALLTKQTYVAAGLAGAIWLVRQDWRKAVGFLAVWVLPAVAAALALEAATGAFFANTIFANANPMRADLLTAKVIIYMLTWAGPMFVVTMFLARARSWTRTPGELLVLYWLTSVLPFSGLAKVGSSTNYWLELSAMTTVLATLGLWTTFRPDREPAPGRATRLAVMLIGLSIASVVAYILPRRAEPFSLALAYQQPEYRQELARVVARVQAEPGDVLAEPLDVPVLAGRRIVFEPFTYSIFYEEGLWDHRPLVQRICNGELRLLVLGYPLEEAGARFEFYARWPAPIVAALRDTMVLESRVAERYLYVPRSAGGGAGCGSGA